MGKYSRVSIASSPAILRLFSDGLFPYNSRRRVSTMKRFLSLCAITAAMVLSARESHAQRRVLVFGPGGTQSVDALRSVPSVMTGPLRGEFTIATEAMWRSLTTAQFASYNAIWIDGGNCGGSASLMQPVTDTRLTWSPAITGHFEIIGSDSDFHIGHPGARKFTTNSYHYVTSGAGTGLFVSTSCIFAGATADTPVPWLQGIGDFRVTGDGCTDGQMLEPYGATHAVHLGIGAPTSAITLPGDLAWGCFTHSHFNRHPPSFNRVYSIGGLGPGRGVVIVNDRGGCVIDADCLPGQFCNRDAAGGEPVCRTTLGNGRECTTDMQCSSGICTEGVCCNARCSGACESCRNAGSVGLCSATNGAPVGARPACTNFGTTCGGRCDGMNRTECTFTPTTTECSSASCSGVVAVSSAFCDGRGSCGTPRRTECNPFVCGATACLTMCRTAADCATGFTCTDGRCVPTIPPGRACTSSAMCATGSCVDGVCCNTACTGQCEACDNPGMLGTCSPVRGAPHSPRAACVGTGVCAGTCDGTVRNACAYPNDQTQCGMPSCVAGRETPAAVCDGRGMCNMTSTARDCGRYACSGTACRTSCDTDIECASGNFCRDGVCTPRLPNGGRCTTTGQCASGNCVDGVCCNVACEGQCEACDVEGSVGTCSPVRGVPHTARPACAGAGPCLGVCDGTARTNCTYPGASIECRAPSCAEGTATNRGTCDGTGGCGTVRTAMCSPYTCNGTTCREMCAADAECITGYRCEMGRCVPRSALGGNCTTDAQCGAGGVCSGGVCCNERCDGQCQSCILLSRVGTCTPLPASTQTRASDGGRICVCDGIRGTCRDDPQPDASTPTDRPVSMDAAPPVQVIYTGAGCGCSAPGTSSNASSLALIATALAWVMARRRR
jgi:uncharacterized protein (TIGR03382 family)